MQAFWLEFVGNYTECGCFWRASSELGRQNRPGQPGKNDQVLDERPIERRRGMLFQQPRATLAKDLDAGQLGGGISWQLLGTQEA